MASLTCPQCGKDVIEQPASCPHCGFALWSAPGGEPRRKTSKWVWWLIGIAVACPVGFFALAILNSIILPPVVQKLRVARHGKAMADIVAIEQALDEYAINNGARYPESLEILVAPDANGRTYLKQTTLPLDPWKRAYRYEPPGPDRPRPRVYTLGKDGKPGGEGQDTDVDSLELHREK